MVEYPEVAGWSFSTAPVLFTEVPNKEKAQQPKLAAKFPFLYKGKAFHNVDRDWNWMSRESKESPFLQTLKTQLHIALSKMTLY